MPGTDLHIEHVKDLCREFYEAVKEQHPDLATNPQIERDYRALATEILDPADQRPVWDTKVIFLFNALARQYSVLTSKEEMAVHIPVELKKAENIAVLKSAHANHLIELCKL
jgi:hypothetical protein